MSIFLQRLDAEPEPVRLIIICSHDCTFNPCLWSFCVLESSQMLLEVSMSLALSERNAINVIARSISILKLTKTRHQQAFASKLLMAGTSNLLPTVTLHL